VHLGAVNSINWARVLAQITYYFYSYLRVTDIPCTDRDPTCAAQKVSFAVPTGNFGDILAGYYAQRMGLPVEKLIVCTNQNDVLHRFLQSGEYRRVPAEATLAPSMDISVSSNFERYLFYLADESGEQLAQWMETFEKTGAVRVSASQLQRARQTFCSYAASGEVIVDTMRNMYEREGYLVCPHTATAVAGIQDALREGDSAQSVLQGSIPICLATAHPAKFEEAVLRATQGSQRPAPARPAELEVLFALETRKVSLSNSLQEVESFVRARLL
jgi:threonine synthase